MKYHITFNSIDDFYKECDIQEPTGDPNYYKEVSTADNEDWIGLSLEKIKQSKYFYKEGLDMLKEIEMDLQIGGSKKLYRWDDQDGDELSMERLNENLPFLSKRVRDHGSSGGKFVNLYVNIGENSFVSYKEMLNKSYTAIQIVDYLENAGYKVTIIAFSDVSRLGYYNNDEVELLHTEVVIKKAEEPLSKALLLACISPWMLRHHMFKFWTAKFKCKLGLGSSERIAYTDNKENLYINCGDCLNKNDSQKRIEYFKQLFKEDIKEDE